MESYRPAELYSRRTALTVATAAIGSVAVGGNELKGKETGQPVVHFEIGCRDRAKTERFFGELFGWHIQQQGPASVIDAANERGIAGHITALGHEPQHYTMFYVEVDDVQASLDKATALGGKMVVPPIDIPTGKFAWFSDPDGNTVGLLQPKR
jgi:predicted enzyme related to lactoylglutathione lyase